MVRRRVQSLALVLLGQLALLAHWPAGPGYVVPRSKAVNVARRFKQGPSAAPEPAANEDELVGTWRYRGGAYKVSRNGDGSLFFSENALEGVLKADGDWFVADLPPAGTIRLQPGEAGKKAVSNFQAAGTEDWGETVTALREWETLEQRTVALEGELKGLVFEGVAGDGGVVIQVDGHQRPSAVQVSPTLASASNLDALIKEAHEQASEASLDAMTEKLRQMYADHFAAQEMTN